MMNSNAALVSVVIPFFNAEKSLERAVRSILNQTYKNLELILVDNNSTDESSNIAWLFAAQDERIKIIKESQEGVTFAANTGNEAATGEYIARMDADDYSYPERIEKQVSLLENNPDIDVASCLVKHIAHDENTQGLKEFVDWVNSVQTPDEIRLKCFIEAPVINPTVLF